MKDCDREELIDNLQKLYSQNLIFIAKAEKGLITKHFKKENMQEFIKLNSQLNDYITDIQFGLPIKRSLEEWLNLFADTILDDVNFVVEEDGFQWL